MKAYVILKGGKFDTLMFDADEVINYFNENKDTDLIIEVKTFDVPKEKENFISAPTWPISVPTNGGYRQSICRTWEDCTNPFKDCVNCPLMFSGGGTISSPNSIEPHLHTKDSVLGDSVTVTYTGDTQNSLHQSVLNDTVKVTCTNDTINKQ